MGRGPGGLASAVFTATDARATGNPREIDLDDTRLALGAARIHAGSVRLHGLTPFAHASSVPPAARALALALAGAIAAAFGVVALLVGAVRGRLGGIVVAASGSLAALGAMRSVDRSGGAWLATLAVVPVTAAAVLLATFLLSRLPRRMWTASEMSHG